ncbi:glycosyltransferase [Kosakonia sp.]|uniref:glycosyltransferase family 2 protein n=1 Tax=Kosakonia sp. TaxID=1916651 RepID=UPI0028963605|nr:glycosyltransferase [Kosakonia sp.]
MTTFTLIVPTYNAGKKWQEWLEALKIQTLQPQQVIIIDSTSSDETIQLSRQYNIEPIVISPAEFNHGGTRNKAVLYSERSDFLVFLTQDAILNDEYSLQRIIECFDNKSMSAVCGRQLPHHDASPLAMHARYYNYSEKSCVKTSEDIPRFGIKTVFMSNSFAAYRRSVFEELGKFPEHTILAEDMYLTAKMILAGYNVAYCAEAAVRHSHNYSIREEFQRYFDTGVFHECNPWIQEKFGGAKGEGLKFIKSEMLFLLRKYPLWIPKALAATLAKYLGYRLGLKWRSLSLSICRKLSMYKSYWNSIGQKNE